MVARSFLSDRMETVTIPNLRARGLETRLGIDGRSVSFLLSDGVTVVGDVTVRVEWAGRQPQGTASETTDVIGVDGDLEARPAEVVGVLDGGTQFQLDGNPCEVTRDPIDDRGVGVVPFRMTASEVS